MLPRESFQPPPPLPRPRSPAPITLHIFLLHSEERLQKRSGLVRGSGGGVGLLSAALPTGPGQFVQQQRELELMNSFRERFGCDWLQYRNHLDSSGTPGLATSQTPALSTLSPDTRSPGSVPGPRPLQRESPPEMAEEVGPRPEPQEEEVTEELVKEKEGKEEEEEQEQNEVEGEP